MSTCYVYILECSNGAYYTGITNNIDRRLSEHLEGKDKTCYTYRYRPVTLVFTERFEDPRKVIAFEKQVKGWRREKKKALISRDWERYNQ